MLSRVDSLKAFNNLLLAFPIYAYYNQHKIKVFVSLSDWTAAEVLTSNGFPNIMFVDFGELLMLLARNLVSPPL